MKELEFRRGIKKLHKLLLGKGMLYIMSIFLSKRTILTAACIEQYALKYRHSSSAVGKGESCQRGKSNVKICLLKNPYIFFFLGVIPIAIVIPKNTLKI